MSDNVGGAAQRPSQRVGRFQNQNDIDRISAPPQASSVYQQVRASDPEGLALSGLRARTIKFNNFNFVLRGIPNNKINNQRYSILSFVPIVLFDQFKYFFNLFFLLVCLS
jgi:phospholipid-translocating ATPase